MSYYFRFPDHPPEITLAKAIDKADILCYRLRRCIKKLNLTSGRKKRLDSGASRSEVDRVGGHALENFAVADLRAL